MFVCVCFVFWVVCLFVNSVVTFALCVKCLAVCLWVCLNLVYNVIII